MNATETEQRPTDLALGHNGMFSRNRDHLPWIQRIESHTAWHVLARVPQTVTALIPLPQFTMHDLLTMEKGLVIESSVLTTDMIPIRIRAGAGRLGGVRGCRACACVARDEIGITGLEAGLWECSCQ